MPLGSSTDIVGFVRIADLTTYFKIDRNWEPEMRLIFGLYREDMGWYVCECIFHPEGVQ